MPALRALVLALLAATTGGEARVSLDVKDGSVRDVVGLLAEVGGLQVVFDPDVDCKLTLKLHETRWQTALQTTLRACGLAPEEEAGILRVARPSRLAEEAAARRRLQEERSHGGEARLETFRLSHARAEAIAPLVRSRLSPRSQVTWDARTNTLIVIARP
jgi:type II secretory pathway component HofQ